MRTSLSLICCLLLSPAVFCQSARKTCEAVVVATAPKIDGALDEAVWQTAPVITNFTEFRPVAGKPQDDAYRTEVRVLYDNDALYIGAFMHSSSPDSIGKELAQRDVVGNADFLMVLIDTYNSGINGYGFMVTSVNSQFDARYSNDNNGEDVSWNAVWASATRLLKDGWSLEMRIPYSALRFARKDVQTWGINFMNRRIKTQQDFFWNPIDPTKAGFVNQWGIVTGIKNINPPVRLSFTPYFSTYLDHYPYNSPYTRNTSVLVNGGMDIKYGINESFTLDATLVPDFGQVQSDNKVLNLTPFEVKYNEYRPFFTEGTELFNKGGLFYSRRIGGLPIGYDSVENGLAPGERIVSNPIESRLLNATKISGRTRHGLGIGFFNALTERTFGVIEDANGKRRSIETAPLTNYNIAVLDQSLQNNSSVSLVNTNVTRFGGSNYNANVTAGLFNLFTKNNTYNLSGQATVSQLYGGPIKPTTGTYYTISGGKSSGKFNAIFTHTVMDDKYNINDLGILFNNNEIDNSLNLSYNIVKPGKWYNSLFFNAGAVYSQHFVPRDYQNFVFNASASTTLKNLWQLNLFADWSPWTGNDFYEPRVPGRIYVAPRTYSAGFYLHSNRAKRYAVTTSVAYRKRLQFNGNGYDFFFDHSYRFSDKFSLEQSTSYSPRRNYAGFAAVLSEPDSILFGRRNVNTIENILAARYTFNSNMGFTIRLRHYVSGVHYNHYYMLDRSGNLGDMSYNGNQDVDLNLFNVDFVYTWWFAPGSQISIAWKNSIQNEANLVTKGYFYNLNNTFQTPQDNSISFKILYYLDYIRLKHHRRQVSHYQQ